MKISVANVAYVVVVACFLFCAVQAGAQGTPYPALRIAVLGSNTLSLTITNGVGSASYEILWTPVLQDTVDYPWRQIAAGSPGQTNFTVNKGAYGSGFFDADMVSSWEVGSGMVAWWLANQIGLPNGAAMTHWTDRYGNVLQGSATFDASGMNGFSAVDFNRNANNALSNAVVLASHPSLTNCGTLFAMFAWPHPAVLPGGEAILDCSISNNATWFLLSPTTQTGFGMNFLEDGWLFNNGPVSGGNITFDSDPSDDEHLFLMTWTNGVWQDYVDGKVVDNYPNGAHLTTPVFPVALMGMLTAGNIFNGTWPFQGSISEIGIATNYWNFQTVDQAANDILTACGMLRPTIVLHGDSMTWGGNGSYLGGLTDYLSTNFPGWTIDNCAIPGTKSALVLSNFLYMANYTTGGSNKIDIFWDNVNLDVLGDCTNNLYVDAKAALANGKIPVLVIPPSNPLTDTNGERFVFEDTMTNNPGSFQFLCNLSLNAEVGYSNAWTNGIYYEPVGGIHLTNTGNATISVQFISTIEQIINH